MTHRQFRVWVTWMNSRLPASEPSPSSPQEYPGRVPYVPYDPEKEKGVKAAVLGYLRSTSIPQEARRGR